MFLFKFRTSRELLSSCPHVIKDDPLPIKMDSEQNMEYNKMCKAKMMKTFDTDHYTLFRPGREPERRHSSYYPNLSQPVSRTPSHGSDYAKFRDAMQILK